MVLTNMEDRRAPHKRRQMTLECWGLGLGSMAMRKFREGWRE